MTRIQWESVAPDWTKGGLAVKHGCYRNDGWNAAAVYRKAFADPKVNAVEIKRCTTGLYRFADVLYYEGGVPYVEERKYRF